MVSSSDNRSDKGVSIGIYFAQGEGSPRPMFSINDPKNVGEEIYLVTVPRDQLHTIVVRNYREDRVFVEIDAHGQGTHPQMDRVLPGTKKVFNRHYVGVFSHYETAAYTVVVTEEVNLLPGRSDVPNIQVTNQVRRVTFLLRTAAAEMFFRQPLVLTRICEEVVVLAC